MFTLLPGVGRARYGWLYMYMYIVIDRTFASGGGVDLRTHLFIDHRRASFFRMFNFRGWRPRPRNYFNSEIFPIYGM